MKRTEDLINIVTGALKLCEKAKVGRYDGFYVAIPLLQKALEEWTPEEVRIVLLDCNEKNK